MLMKYMYIPLRRMSARFQKLLITPLCIQFHALSSSSTSALHRLRNTIGLARVDGFAGLLDLLQNGCVVQVLLGCDGCGLALEGDVEVLDACEDACQLLLYGWEWGIWKAVRLTIELLQHALHGAGAAAAGHGDVELVVVLGHFEWWFGVSDVSSRLLLDWCWYAKW
jgi:hypothetical protein